MLTRDFIRLAIGSVWAHRMRSFLTALGIAVGIASVILLTSIGEGIHRFVLAEFTQFGTNLIAVTPGKASTLGMSGAVVSNVRPLSMDDAEALKRLPRVLDVVPVVQGNAAIEAGHDVVVSSHRFAGNGRAMIIGDVDGMVKVVAARDSDGRAGRILGVHMVGPWVTEQLGQAYMAVNWEATVDEVAEFIQPHPTLSELFGETVMALTGRALHG